MRTQKETKPSISKEKQEEYKVNRANLAKKNREKRKQEALNGTKQNRHLAFLYNVMVARGHNMSSLAKLMGCTQQSLHWIFNVRDDCKISRAEEILDALGLNLKVRLKRETDDNLQAKMRIQELKEKKFNSNGVENSITGDFIELNEPVRPVKVPDYILNCPKDARLRFLADYFIDLEIGLKQFENMMGFSNSYLLAAITRDDMLISQVFTIAEKTGGQIVWEINRK